MPPDPLDTNNEEFDGFDSIDTGDFTQYVEEALALAPDSGEELDSDEYYGLDDTDALKALFDVIIEQYLPAIQQFIQQLFKEGINRDICNMMCSTVEPLLDLTSAIEYWEMHSLVMDVQRQVTMLTINKRSNYNHIKRIKDWYLRFLDELPEEVANRYRDEVSYRRKKVPFLEDLRSIKGVGPKRLERLYLAGLISMDKLLNADAMSVHQVTGLGYKLSKQVISETHKLQARYVAERIERIIESATFLTREVSDLRREEDREVKLAIDKQIAVLHDALERGFCGPKDRPTDE